MYSLSTFDFFFLRSPHLSLSFFDDLNSKSNEKNLEQYLKKQMENISISEAILLASPIVWNEVQKCISGKIPFPPKLTKTLFKYMSRMSTRCTPFGLFSGIAIGKFSNCSNTYLNRSKEFKVKYRLDMEYLTSMVQILELDLKILSKLKFYSNNTLYQQNNNYKFYQRIITPNQKCQTVLTGVKKSDILSSIVQCSQKGVTINELKELLSSKGFEDNNINHFLHKVIKSQFLISELTPNVLGKDFFNRIIEKLHKIDESKKHLTNFDFINQLILDASKLTNKFESLVRLMQDHYKDLHQSNILQGDMLINMNKDVISHQQIQKITQQIQELQVLANRSNSKNLDQFKQDFVKRYEGQSIPLLEALDPDTGIGYGALSRQNHLKDPILRTLKIQKNTDLKEDKDKKYEFILAKYLSYFKAGNNEINITDEDLLKFGNNKNISNQLPPTLYAIGTILTQNSNVENLEFLLSACTGSSAGNLISRFGHISHEIHQKLAIITEYEQSQIPYSIITEISHLPESKSGNILQRPHLRQKEIQLTSISKGDNNIDLSDLYLFIKKDKLILWSKKYDKEIIPRITSAHNFNGGFHIYQFLGDLQSECGHMSIFWDWGNLKGEDYLPQVRYKDIILSSQQWNIKRINKIEKDNRVKFIKDLIERKKIPNDVNLIEGDNELFLNLNNPIAREILYDILIKKDVVLKKCLPTKYTSILRDTDKNVFNNEIIIPIKSNCDFQKCESPTPPNSNLIKRSFQLGSEWIYVKIYCGQEFGDYLIKNNIARLIEELTNNAILKQWFFIRYNDPAHHIRLRIEVKNCHLFHKVVQKINESMALLLENRLISEVKFETYHREIERYFPEHMEISELFFHIDSCFVLSLLSQNLISQNRWTNALIGIEQILNAASLSINDKSLFAKNMSHSFSKEFGNNKENLNQLNQVFRENKSLIDNVLTIEYENLLSANQLSHKRIKIFQSVLITNEGSIIEQNKKESMLANHIHMFINRLFANNQRLHEYALYHMLSCYYRMQMGKTNKKFANSSIIKVL